GTWGPPALPRHRGPRIRCQRRHPHHPYSRRQRQDRLPRRHRDVGVPLPRLPPHGAVSAVMRTLTALATRLALAAHAAAVSPADVKKQGVAKVVITSSSPPHGFLDAKTNSLKGIMFEIAQAIA